jgi:hypothetical protein
LLRSIKLQVAARLCAEDRPRRGRAAPAALRSVG